MLNCTVNLHVWAPDAGDEAAARTVQAFRKAMAGSGKVEVMEPDDAEQVAAVAHRPSEPWITIQIEGFERKGRLLDSLAKQLGSDAQSVGVVSCVRGDTLVGLELYRDGALQDMFYFDPEAPWPDELLKLPHDYALWQPVLVPGMTPADLQRRWEMPELPDERLLSLLDCLGLGLWTELDPYQQTAHAAVTWLGFRGPGGKPAAHPEGRVEAGDPGSSAQSILIPQILYGEPAEVKRRCRSLARNVAKAGGWQKPLEKVELVPLDSVPGKIVLYKPCFKDKAIYTLHLAPEISAACYDLEGESSPDWHRRANLNRVRLFAEGLEYPWFSLCLLKTNAINLSFDDPLDRARAAATLLEKMLRWWPLLVKLDSRFMTVYEFAGGPDPDWKCWPSRWGRWLIRWLYDMGVSKEKIEAIQSLEPNAVEAAVRQVLAECHKSEGG